MKNNELQIPIERIDIPIGEILNTKEYPYLNIENISVRCVISPNNSEYPTPFSDEVSDCDKCKLKDRNICNIIACQNTEREDKNEVYFIKV